MPEKRPCIRPFGWLVDRAYKQNTHSVLLNQGHAPDQEGDPTKTMAEWPDVAHIRGHADQIAAKLMRQGQNTGQITDSFLYNAEVAKLTGGRVFNAIPRSKFATLLASAARTGSAGSSTGGQPRGLNSRRAHPICTRSANRASPASDLNRGRGDGRQFHLSIEGQEARLLLTGDGFFEPAGQTVLQFDNASSSEPAQIVCFYLSGSDERPLIEMLDGGTASPARKLGRSSCEESGKPRCGL